MIEATTKTLYILRYPDGGQGTCTVRAKLDEAWAKAPEGATMSSRPFPSAVKMPNIPSVDYTLKVDGTGIYTATHLPTGVVGYSDYQGEAYSAMLRNLRDHLEQQTETVLETK